jgi:hypothetical protein
MSRLTSAATAKRKFMNENPKSIWKKSWTGWRGLFFGWLILMATLAVILSVWLVVEGTPINKSGDELELFVAAGIGMTVIFLVASSIRWLCCWCNFKRLLFGVACLATLIALFYAEEDWRGWHAWNKFKHEWEAKGEHFDLASVVPPPVPDDQNFAMTPIWVESIKATLGPQRARRWYGDKFPDNGRTNFIDRLELNIMRSEVWGWKDEPTNGYWANETITDLKPWQAYYRAPVQTNRNSTITTNEFPIAPQPQTPAQDVLLALGKYDSVIEELRQAGQLPYSRFPLEYTNESPASILLPHLAALKRCSQVLELRAVAELQNGQSDKALDDVKLALQLTDKIRTEPFLISHLVRIAILQITLQPIYEGLAEHQWSDEQLVALDAELSKLNFLPDYKLSMEGEMGCDDGEIDRLRRHPEQLKNLGGYYDEEQGNWPTPTLPGGLIGHLIPSGWFFQNQLRCAHMMVEFYIPLADVNQETISPSAVRHVDEVRRAEAKKATPYNILEKILLPGLGNAAKRFAYGQASVDLARVAIALERYRLAHGEYPESLNALAPQFIGKVPQDVIGGQPSQGSGSTSQPLKYRRTADGQFVLYSVGWNERDDGGVVVFEKGSTPAVDINQGDWVWRYPQK